MDNTKEKLLLDVYMFKRLREMISGRKWDNNFYPMDSLLISSERQGCEMRKSFWWYFIETQTESTITSLEDISSVLAIIFFFSFKPLNILNDGFPQVERRKTLFYEGGEMCIGDLYIIFSTITRAYTHTTWKCLLMRLYSRSVSPRLSSIMHGSASSRLEVFDLWLRKGASLKATHQWCVGRANIDIGRIWKCKQYARVLEKFG